MKIKKEIALCILIILCILFLDSIKNDHFKNEKDEIYEMVSELQDTILNNEDGKDKINELNEKWEQFDKLAAFYTEHNALENVDLKIKLVKKNIEINDNEMTIEYLEEVKSMLNQIYEKDKLKLTNIF